MDMMEKLIEMLNPYDYGKKADQMFIDAFNESFEFHYQNNLLFKKNADAAGFLELENIDSAAFIPCFFVDLFKSRRMCSVPSEQIRIRLSSSGTGGRKSYHYLDQISLERIEKIVRKIFADHELVSSETCNYLCFTYDPAKAKDVGTAFSDRMLTDLTGKKEVYYALKYSEEKKDFVFSENDCLKKLAEFEKSGLPLRILGFPAYIWKVLSQRPEGFCFPESSAVITGGGWKLHTGQEVPKQTFKKMIAEKLGIIQQRVIDTYGMVEHGIPYVDCPYGNFHVPVYARILIRNPLDLRIKKDGEPGIMQLLTPYMHSFPAISLLTTDKAVLQKNCQCGRKTPFFTLLGRGGVKKHKGCAINAAELLARQEGGK